MQALLDIVLQYIWGVWRFRWTALFVAWVLSIAGWAFVENMDDKYLATARISVDSNRVLEPLLRGMAIQPDVQERVRLMSKSLLTRPNLKKLVVMSDLDVQAKTESEYEALLTGLKNTVGLRGTRGNSSLYRISYSHTDPELAKRVVQSLITIFVEQSLGEERQDSKSAQAFLEQQILANEERLVEAENRLSKFKRDHAGKMPNQAGGYYQRLDTAIDVKRTAGLELKEAENRRSELRRQIAREAPLLNLGESGGVDSLSLQIQTYEQELQSLLFRYTDKHPRVSQLREAISRLRSKRSQDTETQESTRTANTVDNPVYQEMRSSLSETEARIAELEVRVVEFARQEAALRDTIDSIPAVEAELQQLDRDYVIIKDQHASLLQRRESARLSEQVEQNVDDVKFRVVDPAYVPLKPSEPNKLLLNGFVLVASSGLGLGISLLLSLIRPVFYSRGGLLSATGMQVLGNVSFVTKPGFKLKLWMGRTVFASMAATLLAIFVGLSYIRVSGIDLHLKQRLNNFELVNRVKDSELIRKVENSAMIKKLEEITAREL